MVNGLIVSVTMEELPMNSPDDTPPEFENVVSMNALAMEKKEILDSLISRIVSKFVNFSYHPLQIDYSGSAEKEFTQELLSIGLFYLEYLDSIREGDGDRVLRCWKYLLPIYYNANRTNYCKEALLLLCQHK